MIEAGVILIQFDKPITVQDKNDIEETSDLDIIKVYVQNPQQLSKLELVVRLERLQTIMLKCVCLSEYQCFIDIYIYCHEINDALKRDGQYFLELLQMVNRASCPRTKYLPAFGIPAATSLLDIFVNLPSPHMDNRLTDWCENPDIRAFLTEDIQARIPGMKTILYTYQKVRFFNSFCPENT